MRDFVYIKFERNNEVNKEKVCIGDIGDVYCNNSNIENRVKAIRLLNINNQTRGRYVFSIVDVCKKVNEECSGVDVINVGETDFIVDYVNPHKPWYAKEWTKYVKLVLICLITFFGSAFTIIAYDNDVDIDGIFENLYTFLQGGEKGRRILEFTYSLGLGAGIIVFFNHFGGKKITNDPTPIEVEMSSYEKEIDSALIDRNSGKGKGA